MNFIKKGIVLIVCMILTVTIIKAQNNTFSNTITLGIGTPIRDSTSVGFHMGYNPSVSLSEYLAIEGQLSYFNTQLITVLSDDIGTVHSFNALIGPRINFIFEDNENYFHLNFLVGSSYSGRVMDRTDSDPRFNFGLSFGGFFNIRQFTFGLSYDTPRNVVFKAGHTF